MLNLIAGVEKQRKYKAYIYLLVLQHNQTVSHYYSDNRICHEPLPYFFTKHSSNQEIWTAFKLLQTAHTISF